MKQLFTVLAFLCLCFSLNAQIQKGSISLNGQASIRQQWSAEEGQDGFSAFIAPAISFMVSDHLLIGGAIGGGAFGTTGNSASWAGVIQPEVRYYFNPTNEGNKFFIGAAAGLLTSNLDNSNFAFGVGTNRFLNNNIALEAILNYQLINDSPDQLTLALGLRSFMNREERNNWKNVTRSFAKGDMIIGTTIGQANYVSEALLFQFSPSIVYFLNDKFAIGGQVAGSFNVNANNNNFRSSSLSIAPMLRYYLTGEQRWRWFGEAGAIYLATSSEFDEFFESENRFFGLNAKVGSNIFLASNLALEVSIGGEYFFDSDARIDYNESTVISPNVEDFDGKLDNNRFNLIGGVRLQYFLNRKED